MKKLLVFVLIATLCSSLLAFASCDGTPVFTAEEMLPLCDQSETYSLTTDIVNIRINADVYAVAIHNIEGDKVTVDYVSHSRVTVTVTEVLGSLSINQVLKGSIFTRNRLYMVIGIPDSLIGYNIVADIDTGSLSIENSKATKLQLDVSTGAVNVDVQNAVEVNVDVDTGAVNLKGKSEYVTVDTDTGAIKVDMEANKLFLSTDTGAINFEVTNNTTIHVESDTGSIRGTIHGDKAQYSILVDVDTGSCNVKDQIGTGSQVLEINVDTGSARIDFVQ